MTLFVLVLALSQTVDHRDVVASAKAQVLAAGLSPDVDECARWEVTRRVVMALASEGAGLIAKGGNNCQGYAVDALMYRDGTVIDVLGAGPEGPNTPHWLVQPGKRPVSDWRDAPPLESAPTSEPPATVEDHDAALHRIEAQLEQLRADVASLRELEAADTDAVQTHIDQVVKNAERSAPGFLAALAKVLTLGIAK